MTGLNVAVAGMNALSCALFKPLKIAVVDVGQGNATLVMAPNGKNYLIDSGYTENTNTNQSNADAIMKVLSVEGREPVIHGVVVSHYDRDHMEGFIDCDDDNPLLPTELLIDKSSYANWDTYRPYAACRDTYVSDLPQGENSGHIQIGENGENLGTIIDLGEDYQMILVAGGGYVWAGDDNVEAVADADSENEQSIVVMITNGAFTGLFLGDATGPAYGREDADVETPLAENLLELGFGRISLLNVGHHGASNATGADFINMLSVLVAYISVGDQNYNHPTTQTVNTLDANVDAILQTNCGDASQNNEVCNDPESEKKRIVGTTVIQVQKNGEFTIFTPSPEDLLPYSESIYLHCDDEECSTAY